MALLATATGMLATPASAAPPALVAQTFTTPALADGNARFVDAAVRDLLGRAATRADLDRWRPILDRGLSRETFAGDIARTPEWASVVVTDLYSQVFDRAPDTSGLGYWAGHLAAGMRTADLAGLLYASAEFYEASGSTSGGYVDRLYLRILHRLPDDGGRAYWISLIDGGGSRTTVARVIFLSLEGNGERVDTLYGRLLNRATDPGGRAYWARTLIGTDDLVLAGLLVGSPEYFSAAQGRYQSATITTRPGTTVIAGSDVGVSPYGNGRGHVTVPPGGPVPDVGTLFLASDGEAAGLAFGTVTDNSGGVFVVYEDVDLTDVLSFADVRSTVELPRTALTVPRPIQPRCAAGSATLDVSQRLTADVTFEGHLRFDSTADSYDVAADVLVASGLTSTMAAAGQVSGCAGAGDGWTARWRVTVAAGPIGIPLTVALDGLSKVEARSTGRFRSGATVSVPCRVGFRATSSTAPTATTGCDSLGGRAGAEPSTDGRIIERVDLTVDATLGVPHSGVGTSGTITPAVTTSFGEHEGSRWWTVGLDVSGRAAGQVRLRPWSASADRPDALIVRRDLARSPAGTPPPAAPLSVATGRLRRGAVGQPYTMGLAASGGAPGVTWSATGLPTGLRLAGERLAGTPIAAGTTTVVLTATDTTRATATRTVPIRVEVAGTSLAAEQITDGNGGSGFPELSADGRYVVFGSTASDLVPDDGNGAAVDVFTFDRDTGVLIRLTRGLPIGPGFESRNPWTISADGRYVAFGSTAPSTPWDDNGVSDIFVWDRATGRSSRITDGDAGSHSPSISADGGLVAFTSHATDLVPGAGGPSGDAFLWSRDAGTVRRISENGGREVALSGDGSTATFSTRDGLHLADLTTGHRTLLAGPSQIHLQADLTHDGRAVTYSTFSEVFLFDRTTGVTRSVWKPGYISAPAITDDAGTIVFDGQDPTADHAVRAYVWDAASGSSTPIDGSTRDSSSTISADGSTIAHGSAGSSGVVNIVILDRSASTP
jgi:Tol biopolymer transport system component